MELVRSMTASVYVVSNHKVLLHKHKKFQSLFPLGGHLLPCELPHEAAIREVFEESGLMITLFDPDIKLPFKNVRQLKRPAHILLENIGQPVENIDFIFFATVYTFDINPGDGESRELYWLTEEEVKEDNRIEDHIRIMTLEALKCLRNKDS